MNIQPSLNNNTALEDSGMFDKKQTHTTSFKYFYISQNEDLSPFIKKKRKAKFKSFKKLSSYLKNFFHKPEQFSKEKQQINNIVVDLIQDQNYLKFNQILENGFIPSADIASMIVNKTQSSYFEEVLLTIQDKQPLHDILAQILFVSKNFAYNCYDKLLTFQEYFPEEVLHPDFFTDQTKPYNKSYKNIYINHDIGNSDYATAAIQMHNSCLNPTFSMSLFSYCLKRVLNHKKYESEINSYCEVGTIDDCLLILYRYVKKYLTKEDKDFIFNMLYTPDKIKSMQNGTFPFCLSFLKKLADDNIKINVPKYTEQEKQNLLNMVPVIYKNQKNDYIHQLHFLNLTINENSLLTEHQNTIRVIKNIHTKLCNHENLLHADDIDKINKIVLETLPITIEKYEKIDPDFRESVKNIEGKNANLLFSESLHNVLVIMKDCELKLEQAKVNDLSLINRKNKVI